MVLYLFPSPTGVPKCRQPSLKVSHGQPGKTSKRNQINELNRLWDTKCCCSLKGDLGRMPGIVAAAQSFLQQACKVLEKQGPPRPEADVKEMNGLPCPL